MATAERVPGGAYRCCQGQSPSGWLDGVSSSVVGRDVVRCTPSNARVSADTELSETDYELSALGRYEPAVLCLTPRCLAAAWHGDRVTSRLVQIQFDYADFPIRADISGRATDVDGPLELPISATLRESFRRWSADMSRELQTQKPSATRVGELNERGIQLAEQVRHELGGAYRVEYFDEISMEFRAIG